MFDQSLVARARRARRAAARAVRANPRVRLVDIGRKWRGGTPTDELAVRFHVPSKPRGDDFERLRREQPALLIDTDRVPHTTDIIEGRYLLHPTATVTATPTSASPTTVHRPVVGGISVGNAWSMYYGTLGGIVLDPQDSMPMALSNWHVLVGSSYARPGLPVHQPALADSWWASSIGVLGRDGLSRGYDAAVAPLWADVPWREEQLGLDTTVGQAATPVLGARVRKSGRGSGVTTGKVDGIDGVFTWSYAGRPTEIVDVCTIVPDGLDGEPVARPGDSGSWWVDDSGAVCGLHFAGQVAPTSVGLAMAMPPVLAALDVRLP